MKRLVPNTDFDMWILCNLCLVVSFSVSIYGQNDVRKPPSITNGPTKEVFFKENSAITMTCKAEGIPAVTYEWKKNGVEISLNLLSRGLDGDITIGNATRNNEGFYQCFAWNQYGTALSTVAHIQMAFLNDISERYVNRTVPEGRPFFIRAAVVISSPTPTFKWEIATRTKDPKPKQFTESQRVTVASNGDLYFAYALQEDELDGSIYESRVSNANTHQSFGGSYTRVFVTREPSPDFATNITYFSKSQEIALIGRDIELKCFFSGKPLPDITWSGPGNNLPSGRIKYSTYKTELTISNVSKSDEGGYVCTAKNTNGSIQHTINIRVEAEPIFRRESDGPRNVDVTEGESVTFSCLAFAIPEATVVWLRNGQPIDVTKGPKRFVFSEDGKSLTIRDVCRDCVNQDRETDLTVIQCNASNVHGYAFASGYLNVLLRTKVTLQPNSTSVSVDLTKENRLQFDCSATSDPSTPPTVRWYKVGDLGQELVYDELPYIHVMKGNLTIYTAPNCSTTCHKYFGKYMCVGDNLYTRDNATVILNGTIHVVVLSVLPASPNWIVIGIAVVLFVLLVLLICCIICLLRKKGDEYDVDGKERKSGRSPEKEIRENDFQDYYPSEYNKSKGSPASLRSTVMFRGIDDVIEYDDYAGNFAEDGSFVGKYRERPLYE